MNPLELSDKEIENWSPLTQALAKISYAHFEVFNTMESAATKRLRDRYQKGLGKLQRAAAYLRETRQ